jgi:hypothetical protein
MVLLAHFLPFCFPLYKWFSPNGSGRYFPIQTPRSERCCPYGIPFTSPAYVLTWNRLQLLQAYYKISVVNTGI